MTIEVQEVLSQRNYAAGYVVRKEIWANDGMEPIEMVAAYTPSGDYIGDSKWAYRLCKARGIKPEKRSADSSVCSIGFCEVEQKWYGWSHRAIFGFGIGDSVKRGDCAYHPTDKEDFLLDMVRFWTSENHIDVKGEHTTVDGLPGANISWTCGDKIPNEKRRGTISGCFQPYPETYGRGEWTAETMADAKQMACDFADSVS